MAAAPFSISQELMYCRATSTLRRNPASVIFPPGIFESTSWAAVVCTSERSRSFWLALSPSLASKTSLAVGTRSGCATQVPSKPSPTSRRLSSRTLASAAALISGFFRLGMNGDSDSTSGLQSD